MWCQVILVATCLLAFFLNEASTAKQQVQLSESYLPVAMQVIAHLCDQMAFESKDDVTKAPPTTKPPKPVNDWAKPTIKPTNKPPSSWPQKPTQKPVNDWQKPTSKPPSSWPNTSKPSTKPPYTWPPYTTKPPGSWSSWTTSKPYVINSEESSASKPHTSTFKPPISSFQPPIYLFQPTVSAYKPPGSATSTPAFDYTSSSGYKPTSGFGLPTFPTLGSIPSSGWWMNYGLLVRDSTTPFHRPGFYAPLPPKPHERFRVMPKSGYLLPFDHHAQYTVIEPQETRSETLLSLQDEEEEVEPLVEHAQDTKLLPPHFDEDESDKLTRADDLPEDNLQYLSEGVQEMLKMAHDPDDERLVDVWEGIRGANNQEIMPKGKLSASNLRLLLLYDLLSREAKRLRLSDYSGFSPSVLKALSESSSGGARAQLSLALSRMVERNDCQHEYANNRAREMVQELAKDESKLSSEIRYLQPLIYQS